MGTGVPFVLRNFTADHSHRKEPIIKKGAEIAMLKGMETNRGNPQYPSRKKEINIRNNTMLKNIKPTNGVKISLILSVPVAIL
jgi:hypothetical protein